MTDARNGGFPPSGEGGEGCKFQPFARPCARTLDGYKREPSPPSPVPGALLTSRGAARRASLATIPGGGWQNLCGSCGARASQYPYTLPHRHRRGAGTGIWQTATPGGAETLGDWAGQPKLPFFAQRREITTGGQTVTGWPAERVECRSVRCLAPTARVRSARCRAGWYR